MLLCVQLCEKQLDRSGIETFDCAFLLDLIGKKIKLDENTNLWYFVSLFNFK
jgi:hypothetical protein